ncbi:universal stress protein [Microbacterium aureliae]
MTERILVGVVPGDAGRRAVEWAAHRAAARRAPLELFRIIGGAVGVVGEASLVTEMKAETAEHLAAEADSIRYHGIPVTTRVDHGNPVAKLIEASKDAGLLVIGSDYHVGGRGPARGLHGIRISAGAHCPVVVVPDTENGERAGVVVGVDGSELSEKAIAFAAAEADRLGEPLVAVTAWQPMEVPRSPGLYPATYMESLHHLAEEAQAISLAGLPQTYPDLKVEKHVDEGCPADVLSRYAATARLTVLGSHGRGVVARFLLGSVSEQMLYRLKSTTAIVR